MLVADSRIEYHFGSNRTWNSILYAFARTLSQLLSAAISFFDESTSRHGASRAKFVDKLITLSGRPARWPFLSGPTSSPDSNPTKWGWSGKTAVDLLYYVVHVRSFHLAYCVLPEIG